MSTASVTRAYRFHFYPTDGQAVELSRTFGCVRLVYNRALDARTAAWHQEQRWVGYTDTSALLTTWKKTDELGFLNEVSSVPLQQGLRHLQKAFTHFFDDRAEYSKSKSRKKSRASAEYTRSGFRWRDGLLTLAKMDRPLDIVWSRPLPDGAEPSTVTVSRDPAGRWHVSILVDRWCPSSKTCSRYGYLLEVLPLGVREWVCPGCGDSHDRDVNAARNILAAGRAVAACGDGVRPIRR